jgi:hypothetical protein
MQKQLRLSLHASDMLTQPQQQQQQQQTQATSSSWVLQTTEDGSEKYYYNIQTQEMRYSMPPDFYSEDMVNQTLYSNQSNSSLNDAYQQQQDERPPARPVRAANRVVTDSFYGGDFRKTRNISEYGYLPSRAGSTVPGSQPTMIKSPLAAQFEDDIRVIQITTDSCSIPNSLLSCLRIGSAKHLLKEDTITAM